MLFNSYEFLVFAPLVFLIYWFALDRSLRLQNLFLIAASYVFYGWWDWRFLALIVFSSTVDYLVGRGLERTISAGRRRALLLVSLAANLGCLGTFKYLDFFIESAADVLRSLGLQANLPTLQVVLPVGISFYTFQTLSYTIDVYRRRAPVTRDAVAFFGFVAFFPQLVAGPIERSVSLLPQFERARQFDLRQATDGLRQCLWGAVKKVVIADGCGVLADQAFAGDPSLPGLLRVLGVVFFAFQIYGDFSGYSDIAIGTAKLFGFRLSVNFRTPYFSQSVGEFWRRWHISLSTWFRDYVYIPLGGGRCGLGRRVANLIVTFAVSGLWHGANWTFVVWGLLNGLFCVPAVVRRHLGGGAKSQQAGGGARNGARVLLRIGFTFALTLAAWTFFRAPSLTHAFDFLGGFADVPFWHTVSRGAVGRLLAIAALVSVEWRTRDRDHPLDFRGTSRPLRWTIYITLSILVAIHFGNEQPFIYFQF